MNRDLHDPGTRHACADDEGAADDDDDIVAEAGKSTIKGNDPDSYGQKQRAKRHHVITELAPDKCPHHKRNDSKGQYL